MNQKIKIIIIFTISCVLLNPTNVFAEYEIDNVCDWAKLNSQTLWPIDIVKEKFREDLPLQHDIYQKLLRENYEDWEIDAGLVPMDVAQGFLDESKFIRNGYAIDKTIDFFDINPNLKSLLLPRYNTVTWDEYVKQSFIVDYMLHPDFYGNDQKCEQEFIEENWERFSYLLIQVYGKNRSDVIYEEIEKRVYGEFDEKIQSIKSDEITKQEFEIKCGQGTIEKNGQCVVIPNYDIQESSVFTENTIQWKGNGENITVQTDKLTYHITDLIRIFGYVNDFNKSEHLEINIFQNGKVIHNEILEYSGAAEYFREGYFSVIINPEYHPIPFDWSGQYTVEAIHQQQKAITTFSFIGTDTFDGLYSISKYAVLQIDKKNYDLKNEIMDIHVSGRIRQSTSDMGDELKFQINGPEDFTLKEFKKWSSPIPLPENVGELSYNNIVKKIEFVFQIDSTWKSGKYSISITNVNMPKIEFTVNNPFYVELVC